jgi:hypothetical protein
MPKMSLNLSCRFALCLFMGALPGASGVTFLFSAPISTVYGPGADAISNLVSVGMICTGTVSYNPSAASPDIDPAPNYGFYTFKGSDMKMSLTVGTNMFSSTDSSSCNIRVAYQLSSPFADGLNYEANQALLNGGPVPGATDTQTLDVALSTTNLQALTSDALPVLVPQLEAFPFGAGSGYVETVFYTYKNGVFNYGFSGTLDSIIPVPPISAQVAGGQLMLSWPTNALGFQLQATPTPVSPASWTNLTALPIIQDGSFQVAVPVDVNIRFFRLSSSVTSALARSRLGLPPSLSPNSQIGHSQELVLPRP